MKKDFQQIGWDQSVENDCRELVRLAVREDLDQQQDWTTISLVPPEREGMADIVAREAGVVAGLPALFAVVDQMQARLAIVPKASESDLISAGTKIATIKGNVRDLLTSERIMLNLLGRLMGIATLSRRYVDAVASTQARVYDTRKTTLGWRRLEKYAARCGGAFNHRTGLFDAILIKDNHLAQLVPQSTESQNTAAAAVLQARQFLDSETAEKPRANCLVEIEVDTIAQFTTVLPTKPDIVLLDNMPPAMLNEAVRIRNAKAPQVQLEASGGVRLETIREIAQTGVDRISVGALTHSARSLDVGLDWCYE